MTAATGLKRLAIAVAGIVAAAFATLVGLSFLMPATSVRDAVKKALPKEAPHPGSFRVAGGAQPGAEAQAEAEAPAGSGA